jgi:hypothetical protein
MDLEETILANMRELSENGRERGTDVLEAPWERCQEPAELPVGHLLEHLLRIVGGDGGLDVRQIWWPLWMLVPFSIYK